jgi:hypothetical protein
VIETLAYPDDELETGVILGIRIGHDPFGHYDSPSPHPPVPPRNWRDPADGSRFERARASADLAFLEKHKLLTVAERAALSEMRNPRRFGPQEETDDEAT